MFIKQQQQQQNQTETELAASVQKKKIKTYKRLKRTLFNWTRQRKEEKKKEEEEEEEKKKRNFEEVLYFEAMYNTQINNQFIYLLPVGCLGASRRKMLERRGFPQKLVHFVLLCPIKKHSF